LTKKVKVTKLNDKKFAIGGLGKNELCIYDIEGK